MSYWYLDASRSKQLIQHNPGSLPEKEEKKSEKKELKKSDQRISDLSLGRMTGEIGQLPK